MAANDPLADASTVTNEHADCSDFHDREDARRFAKADASHRSTLAVHALNNACQVLGGRIGVTASSKLIADTTKAVADELLGWLATNCPTPSEVQHRIDADLPALEDPHPPQAQGGLYGALLGGSDVQSTGPITAEEGPGSGGGVYL